MTYYNLITDVLHRILLFEKEKKLEIYCKFVMK